MPQRLTGQPEPALVGIRGRVYVFATPRLVPVDTIDLGPAAAAHGFRPAFSGMAVSRDGTRLHIASGTSSITVTSGSGWGSLRLLIVDVATGALVRVVPLDDYGAGSVYTPW